MEFPLPSLAKSCLVVQIWCLYMFVTSCLNACMCWSSVFLRWCTVADVSLRVSSFDLFCLFCLCFEGGRLGWSSAMEEAGYFPTGAIPERESCKSPLIAMAAMAVAIRRCPGTSFSSPQLGQSSKKLVKCCSSCSSCSCVLSAFSWNCTCCVVTMLRHVPVTRRSGCLHLLVLGGRGLDRGGPAKFAMTPWEDGTTRSKIGQAPKQPPVPKVQVKPAPPMPGFPGFLLSKLFRFRRFPENEISCKYT